MKRRPLTIAIALLLAPCSALAESPKGGNADPAAAQSLFYDARTLMEQGRYAAACPKLEESLRLDPGIGTQFNLADCEEHTGSITTAWARFLDVAARAKLSKQPDREKLARKRAAALKPRLPKVIIVSSGPPPTGLEVRRDGVVIGPAAWDTSIPVDPGLHRISVSAPGKQTWERTIKATEAMTTRVSLPRHLEPGGPEPIATSSAPAQPPPASSTTSTTAAHADLGQDFPPPIVESRGATQRSLGWVATGLGTAGLGVAMGFGLSSIASRNKSRAHCSGDRCDESGVRLRDDAMRSGTIATVATIAGGAAVAGGLLLLLAAPSGTSSSERASKLRATPTIATNSGGLSLEGRF